MKVKSAPKRRSKKPAKAVRKTSSSPAATTSFPIVGIGASAGGLEATLRAEQAGLQKCVMKQSVKLAQLKKRTKA